MNPNLEDLTKKITWFVSVVFTSFCYLKDVLKNFYFKLFEETVWRTSVVGYLSKIADLK